MEVTIPYWFLWVCGALIPITGYWLIFLTKMAFEGKENQRVSTLSDAAIMKEISDLDGKMDRIKSELNTKMDENKKDFHESLRELTNRIDVLFGSELSFMKGLATNQGK